MHQKAINHCPLKFKVISSNRNSIILDFRYHTEVVQFDYFALSWSLILHPFVATAQLQTGILKFIIRARTLGIVLHPFPRLQDNKSALYAPIGSIVGYCMTNCTLSKTNINTVNIPVSWALLIAFASRVRLYLASVGVY